MAAQLLKVAKFGGSSLSDPPRFRGAIDIVKGEEGRRFVVVSAPGKRFSGDEKVTDLLYACYDHAQAKNDEKFEETFAKIKERYLLLRDALCPEYAIEEELDGVYASFKGRLGGKDHAASRGEYLCGRLMAACLGFPFVDPAECVFFKDDGSFDAERTNDALSSRLRALGCGVIPGFYGSMPNDTIRTFTRGGSDITGSLVARAVGADLYENWTDVDGFLMADPRIVENPKVMESVTYRELRELSYMGATVLHEDSVVPVRMAGIPIRIKNTTNPKAKGTAILPRRDKEDAPVITGIAGRKGFSAITVEKDMMNGELGFCRKILEVLEENDVNFEHLPTGIDGISVVAPSAQLEGKRAKILNGICRMAKPECAYIEDEIALIAVVGSGISTNLKALSTIFDALAKARIPVLLTNRCMAENNAILGVAEEHFEEAIRAIYNAFSA
jgi:aspartate kinase